MKLGTTELLAILAVVIIIFGPTQIPKLARMAGRSAKKFKEGLAGDEDEKETAGHAEAAGK